MIARRWLALSLLASLFVGSPGRAEYDWYHEEEGSRRAADDDSDDDDDYVPPPYHEGRYAADEGFSLGLRLAYAHPMGDAAKRAELDRYTRGVIKVQLDLDYGVSPNFVIGLYLATGGGLLLKDVKRDCDDFEGDCKVIALESGLAMAYRILPAGLIDPWVGANFGLEWLHNAYESPEGGGSVSLLGLAFAPTLGVDVQLGGFAFGPYFSPQFGRFMHLKLALDTSILDSENDAGSQIDRDQRAFHYWLNFGLRARYQF